jgi:hypothetical protein
MKNRTKGLVALAVAASAVLGLSACSGADIASHNLSKDADNFKIERRVVFYNGITGETMLTIEGRCALGNADGADGKDQRTVTCKTGPDEYKKHFLGLSDNVTYFAEQVDPAKVSEYHYKVVFKPESVLPDFELRTEQ